MEEEHTALEDHRAGRSHEVLGSEGWGEAFGASSPGIGFNTLSQSKSSGRSRQGSQPELTWAGHLLPGRPSSGEALLSALVHVP